MLKLAFLLLLLSLSPSLPTLASDGDDAAELDELLAVDAEDEKARASGERQSDGADLLSRAQRIVVQVTNENVRRVVDGSEYVLVLGYAPWCVRSAEIMPHFAEAATELRGTGSPVVLAKLDAERHPKAASDLGIKGFPTLILFVNGTEQAYTGGFTG